MNMNIKTDSQKTPPGFFMVGLALAFLFVSSAAAEDHDAYFSVTGPCDLRFPQDHGPHPGYRMEWWYYTGNVTSQKGKRFGFQLTFFRIRISPPGAEKSWPDPASAWRTHQFYLAHAAISDIDGNRYLHAEQAARGVLDIAGASQKSGATTVFLKNWFAEVKKTGTSSGPSEYIHHLNASADEFSFDLTLTSVKPPVLNGKGGYSQKGANPESASCYYSFTRLSTRGTMTLGKKRMSVQGGSWMDHEFSSAPLEPNLEGWDWFGIQFDDGTELMAYFLRQTNGMFSPASAATFTDASGKTVSVSGDDMNLKILETWKSPKSGAVYPSRWRLSILPLSLDLTIFPNLADQEMQSPESTNITYWEGSVSVSGTGNSSVKGLGYAELTGYEKPFHGPGMTP